MKNKIITKVWIVLFVCAGLWGGLTLAYHCGYVAATNKARRDAEKEPTLTAVISVADNPAFTNASTVEVPIRRTPSITVTNLTARLIYLRNTVERNK